MPYPIERKLVVGVSSTALFNLEYEDQIYKQEGIDSYKKYQNENKHKILEKGVAYPFIRRFLNINNIFPEQEPVEVVVLSRNSPETGIRTFHSIQEHGLNISRAAFTSGNPAYKYIPAYNISLFLSIDIDDVKNAIEMDFPAGRILPTMIHDDENDNELRVAFDFDGVIADDESEKIFKNTGQLDLFHKNEVEKVETPLNPGLLMNFLKKLAFFQRLEDKKLEKDKDYKKILKTSIITARNAPSHERAINTLKNWDIDIDEMFLMGGVEKKRILEILKPHLFVDDQLSHLSTDLKDIPLVHIPFGIANEKIEIDSSENEIETKP